MPLGWGGEDWIGWGEVRPRRPLPESAPSFDWSVESDDDHDNDVGRYDTDSELGDEVSSQDESNRDLEGSRQI